MAADQETVDAVKALLEQKLAPQVPSAAPQTFGSQPGGLMAPQPALVPTVISFRIKIPMPDGRETAAYLHFDASQCQSPQAIQMLAQQVAAIYPIDAFMPRQQGGWGGGGGYQGGSGYNRGGGGGYGRRWS